MTQTQELYHFVPLSLIEAEALLPLMQVAGGAQATDPMMQMRYADCLLAIGRTDVARDIYSQLIAANPWFLPAHTAMLYLQVKDQPDLVAATDLPLRLRNIYESPLLVWHAFPDTNLEMQQHPYFNRLLGLLAKMLYARLPDLSVLDIGSNIGQSVAEIQYYVPTPCLSVECGAQNFSLTRYNVQRLNPKNRALHALVGITGQYGSMTYVKTFAGFEGLAAPEWIQPDRADSSDENAVAAKSLPELLSMAPEFNNSRLVKIDAEGWDWDIIVDNPGFWQRNQPWLFFENNPEFAPSWPAGNARLGDAVRTLMAAGYQQFLVFDDRGRYVCQVRHDHLARFHELNAFQALNRRTGGSIGHYDILAVPAAEAAWIPELLASMFPVDLYGMAA